MTILDKTLEKATLLRLDSTAVPPPITAPDQCLFFFLRLIRVDQGNGTFANSRTSIELGEGEVRLETHFEFEMGYFVKLI